MKDSIGYKAEWKISKFQDKDGEVAKLLRSGLSVEEVSTRCDQVPQIDMIHQNVALNEGLGELIDLLCGLSSPTAYSHAAAYIGVGDSNTAAAATQTGLQASTNKTWMPMDTSYPARTDQTATWRATFGTSDGNHGWQEFTVVNAATDAGKNLNRKVDDKGTKVSGETWTVELSITFS